MPLALIISTILSMVLDIGLELLNVLPLLALLAFMLELLILVLRNCKAFFFLFPVPVFPHLSWQQMPEAREKLLRFMDPWIVICWVEIVMFRSSVANKFPRKNEGHRALLDGMWNYFSKKSLTKSAWNRHVVITNRAQVILAMHLTICYIVILELI